MADITKCKGTNCPKKEHCYRFTANDTMVGNKSYQSYFVEVPLNLDGSCDEFWGSPKYRDKKNEIKSI